MFARTRKEALVLGTKRYATGKPCPHGHISERYTGDSACIQCKKTWMKDNPEKRRAVQRAWQRKAAGASPPTRPEPIKCECCKGPPGQQGWHADHDHETGRFRGWLCHRCNLGIGSLGDDLAGVLNAVRYLQSN